MRSYEAARALFSFIAFLGWLTIIAGIMALVIGAAFAGNSRMDFAFVAVVPGILITITGFLTVAMAQIGRAGVDSAEYAQQMLQVSRDQIDLSKQMIRQGQIATEGYTRLAKSLAPQTAPTASYEGNAPVPPPSAGAALPGNTSPEVLGYQSRVPLVASRETLPDIPVFARVPAES
jgi:hypothetical protein